MVEEDRLSLVSPSGYRKSSCGYCSPPGKRSESKSSKSFGIWAHHLTPEAYQQLIDQGWRRSGRYVYRPDCGMGGTCCPQLAIRLDVGTFTPKKQHKRSLAAFRRAMYEPLGRATDANNHFHAPIAGPSTMPVYSSSTMGKGKHARTWDVETEWRVIEGRSDNALLCKVHDSTDDQSRRTYLAQYHNERSRVAHERRKKAKDDEIVVEPPLPLQKQRLTTKMYVASSTDEKYALFRKYQAKVHSEAEEEISSRSGFERFLCESPFMPAHVEQSRPMPVPPGTPVDIDSPEPIQYSLYHMEWRLDGKLVAIGVLDVLPRYVSSVYLLYDPDYAHLELGRVSALREIALVKLLQRKRGMSSLRYYNMGLYIHDCQKMRYKASYAPSELLDPQTCQWHRIDQIKRQLDGGKRFGFSSKSDSDDQYNGGRKLSIDRKSNGTASSKNSTRDVDDDGTGSDEGALPEPLPPGIDPPSSLSVLDIKRCVTFDGVKVQLLMNLLPRLSSVEKQQALDCLAALGSSRYLFCLVLQM